MDKIPVIIALTKRPVRSGGGPAGIAYKLLKGLVDDDRFTFYLLSASEAKIWRIDSISDLESISLEFYPSPTLGRLRKRLKRIPLVRTSYHLYRYALPLLHPRNLKIGKAISEILFNRRGILNLQGVPFPTDIPDTALIQDNLFVMWSEHSKGGLTRQWEQLDGERVRNWLSYKFLKRRYAFLLAHSAHIVFPSWGAVHLFEKYNGLQIPRQKLSIVYNGVEDLLNQVDSLETAEEPGLFVTVAEHVPEKGLDIALEGLARLKRPWQWYVVGKRTDWSAILLEKARDLGVIDHINFVEQLPNKEVLKLMARAEAIIMTQRVAVFDLVIIEAMMLGKAVLATPVGGNVEALGEDYPLYIQGAEDLAKVLTIGDEDLRRQGLANRHRYRAMFTEERMLNAYASLYSEIGQ
jgi:glycosyltransferase involved in cell wall biosynthesis